MAMAKGGTLHVTLVSATLLHSSSQQGGGLEADPADSYATLICGKQRFTTRTAKDQGSLPTWNETHAFELEDHDEFGAQDLFIEIFAAKPELNELLGVAKYSCNFFPEASAVKQHLIRRIRGLRLPLGKVIPANEETSLYSLSRPHEGERGQVKVTLKWESFAATTTTQSAPVYGVYEHIQPTAPMYPPASTELSASAHPRSDCTQSYYAEQRYGDVNTPADAAASALAGLALNKDKHTGSESNQIPYQDGSVSPSDFADHRQEEHQLAYPAYPPLPEKRESNPHQPPEIDTFSVNDSGSYASYSTQTPGHYPPQGLPYLASPIGGVVTAGLNYDSPTSAYTHPPFEVTSKLKESESIAQPYGLPANAYPDTDHHYPSTYPPASLELPGDRNKEKVSEVPYETAFYTGTSVSQTESYPPAFQSHGANRGGHSYSGFSQYGASLPVPLKPYSPAASSYPPSADFSNKGQSAVFQETGTPAQHGATAYPAAYPPESDVGCLPNSSIPSSSQYDHSTQQPAGYPGQQHSGQGKDELNLGTNARSQGSNVGGTQEKDFHLYQYAYPPEGYAQPYYPPAAYPQYGYPPQNIGHGYPPQGYPPQYAPQHFAPGYGSLYPQHGHAPSGYTSAPFGAGHGHQVGYGVAAPAYHGQQQQHGNYHHHEGHGGHHGGHKFKGHNGGHVYGHHGYGGHESGHGYYMHKGSHAHGGYSYGHREHYAHH